MAVLLTGSPMANASWCSGTRTVSQFQSHYEIVSVEKFRGGLTSREEAERQIGLKVEVLADLFRLDGVVIDRPVYKLHCYPVLTTEGEVDPHRWSNFYGFKTDRHFIEVLAVYESANSELPRYRLEVISVDELWRTFDGWLFKLRKSAS